METHDIGWAVARMQEGKRVRRTGWNGKGMFIIIMPRMILPAPSDRPIIAGEPYVAMFTAQRKWQPGWLCSQADLLATDWEFAD